MYLPKSSAQKIFDFFATLHSQTSSLYSFKGLSKSKHPSPKSSINPRQLTQCHQPYNRNPISHNWDTPPLVSFTNNLYVYFDTLASCALTGTCEGISNILETHRY
jgi:hypothetical protein